MKPPKLSDDALKRLRIELHRVDAARTLYGTGHPQQAFADHQDPSDTIGVIQQYVSMIDKGLIPSAPILAALWHGFASYLASSGNQTLDYAFGLTVKQRVGHPLTHRLATEQRANEIHYMWNLRHKARLAGKKLSIPAAAGITINELGLSVSESALAKSYKAFKADTIFDGAMAILEEHAASPATKAGK
jgi:hypothetical protein